MKTHEKHMMTTRAGIDSQECPSPEPPGCRSHRYQWIHLSHLLTSYLPEPLLPRLPVRLALSHLPAGQGVCALWLHQEIGRRRRVRLFSWKETLKKEIKILIFLLCSSLRPKVYHQIYNSYIEFGPK